MVIYRCSLVRHVAPMSDAMLDPDRIDCGVLFSVDKGDVESDCGQDLQLILSELVSKNNKVSSLQLNPNCS